MARCLPKLTVDFVDIALDLCLSQELFIHISFPLHVLRGNLKAKHIALKHTYWRQSLLPLRHWELHLWD